MQIPLDISVLKKIFLLHTKTKAHDTCQFSMLKNIPPLHTNTQNYCLKYIAHYATLVVIT